MTSLAEGSGHRDSAQTLKVSQLESTDGGRNLRMRRCSGAARAPEWTRGSRELFARCRPDGRGGALQSLVLATLFLCLPWLSPVSSRWGKSRSTLCQRNKLFRRTSILGCFAQSPSASGPLAGVCRGGPLPFYAPAHLLRTPPSLLHPVTRANRPLLDCARHTPVSGFLHSPWGACRPGVCMVRCLTNSRMSLKASPQ